MSETDNDVSEAPEPTSEPAEKPKIYSSSSKPPFKKASSHKAEIIPDHLSDDIIVKIRASLQEDHGVAGVDMPTNAEATIKAWADIVTKTGTFADALEALGE